MNFPLTTPHIIFPEKIPEKVVPLKLVCVQNGDTLYTYIYTIYIKYILYI